MLPWEDGRQRQESLQITTGQLAWCTHSLSKQGGTWGLAPDVVFWPPPLAPPQIKFSLNDSTFRKALEQLLYNQWPGRMDASMCFKFASTLSAAPFAFLFAMWLRFNKEPSRWLYCCSLLTVWQCLNYIGAEVIWKCRSCIAFNRKATNLNICCLNLNINCNIKMLLGKYFQ